MSCLYLRRFAAPIIILIMTQDLRRKRFNLRLVANQTRRLLFGILGVFVVSLFVWQLFLLNQLSMNGYLLSVEAKRYAELAQTNETLESEIARLQTQEFTLKSAGNGRLVSRAPARFVFVKSVATAQAETEVGSVRN